MMWTFVAFSVLPARDVDFLLLLVSVLVVVKYDRLLTVLNNCIFAKHSLYIYYIKL